jgi:hypothetical protein
VRHVAAADAGSVRTARVGDLAQPNESPKVLGRVAGFPCGLGKRELLVAEMVQRDV